MWGQGREEVGAVKRFMLQSYVGKGQGRGWQKRGAETHAETEGEKE